MRSWRSALAMERGHDVDEEHGLLAGRTARDRRRRARRRGRGGAQFHPGSAVHPHPQALGPRRRMTEARRYLTTAAPSPTGWMCTPQSLRQTAGSTPHWCSSNRRRRCCRKAAWSRGRWSRLNRLRVQRVQEQGRRFTRATLWFYRRERSQRRGWCAGFSAPSVPSCAKPLGHDSQALWLVV